MYFLEGILKDIQSLLETNTSGVTVYRDPYIDPSCDRAGGYFTWDFTCSGHLECSDHTTNVIEGTLDVVAYCTSRTTRIALLEDIEDILFPVIEGYRTSIAPKNLANSFLQQCVRESVFEVFSDKLGHPFPETPGLMLPIYTKFSYSYTG